jgi:hypothetical protein
MTTLLVNYLRGAFIAYEPGGYPDRRRVIPFRFNPESLSRSLQIEQGNTAPATAGAASGAPSSTGEQAADASTGALKESYSVQVRVDFADRLDATRELPEELGVAPEIAALEDLLYPAENEADAPSTGTEAVSQRPVRPTVLFVWGRKRVVPVRITAMTINETEYNDQLNPVRAEIEVTVEVLGQTEAADNEAVRSALAFTRSKRRELASLFYGNTAGQGSQILPL